MKHEARVREIFAQHAKPGLPNGKMLCACTISTISLIDSFGIIRMIFEFESALGVFAKDMQRYEFQMVRAGLQFWIGSTSLLEVDPSERRFSARI